MFPVLKHQENDLFFEGQGSTTSTSTSTAGFRLYCLSTRAGRWAQLGKQGQGTFNGAPLGLPAKDSSSIHLVLLVTAHHCKRDHFLWKEKNKVMFSS